MHSARQSMHSRRRAAERSSLNSSRSNRASGRIVRSWRSAVQARRGKAKLVIAKLDRLSRNVAFLSALMESSVEFVACDNPSANRLTLHVLAAVAENEARAISDRTVKALAEVKAKGVKLGSARPGHWRRREDSRLRGAKIGCARSAEVRRAAAIEAVADLLPEIQERRAQGESFGVIAEALNSAGQRTSRGAQWTAMTVKRVLDRAA